MSNFQIDTSYGTVNSEVPPGRNAVLEWYREKEKKRLAGLDSSNNVEPWFHGKYFNLIYFINSISSDFEVTVTSINFSLIKPLLMYRS